MGGGLIDDWTDGWKIKLGRLSLKVQQIIIHF